MVPRLTEPLLTYCQLPGDLYYLTLRKPGKELDLETAYNFVDYVSRQKIALLNTFCLLKIILNVTSL